MRGLQVGQEAVDGRPMQLRPAGESGEREPVLGGGENVELRRTGGASVGRSDSVSGIVRGQRTSQEG